MIRKIVLFFNIIFSFAMAQTVISEKFDYIVDYFLMPSLTMTMEIQYNYPEHGKNKIDVHTKTKSFFDKIFAIDNRYSTIYHDSDYSANYHKKTINQPNVQQTLEIDYSQPLIQYSNGEKRESNNAIYDFFSMLMFLRTIPRNLLAKTSVLVDMEGEFFQASFEIEEQQYIKVGDEKILTDRIKINYTKPDKNQKSVLDYTDIFFWKIASEDGNKYIWLEQNEERRIIKAKFSEGGGWLEAKLVEGK